MSLSNNYPDIRSVWMNDYANAGVIDPRCVFTRNDSTPSNVHYWSDEDHVSSENLIAYSSDISNSYWTKQGVSPTGGQTAPDGGTDAYKLTENASTSDHRIYHLFGPTPTDETTITFYVKYIGRQWVYVRAKDVGGTNRYCWFDIQNGVVGTVQTNVTASIAASGNGYYKCTVVLASAIASGQSLNIGGAAADGDGAGYAGLNGDAFALWGINMSTLGETTLNETSGQIHREYAATLKPVAYSGQPRFEYEPTGDRSAKGLLIESSISNLAPYSNNFGAWGATNVVAEAGASVGPDGQPCYVMREDSSAGVQHRLSQNVNGQAYSAAHTMSVYAKKVASSNQTRYLRLRVNGLSGEASVQFDLDNGTVVRTSGSQLDGQTITPVGNGWYRLTMTYSNTATSRAVGMIITGSPDTTDTLPSYDGDGYTAFALFGAMVEEANFPSSYTATSSSTSTRSADSLSFIDDSIFEGGEHSIYWEGSVNGSIVDPRFMELSDGTVNNRIQFFYNDGSKVMLRTSVDGVSSKAAIQVTEPITGSVKLMATLKTAEARVVSNGTTITSATSDSFYSPSGLRKLNVGTNYAQGAQLNGHVKRVAVFSEALTEVEAQSLTS